eukprot:TRINITY_DN31960_c0_g2_i1.p1 TRINITY_DN31960_c0_g2~~TRINITY_DN31960_c0_g2_i1.p1  ORF type:complete len:249 (+),score=59.42 TRINITY_DN31960_c0_g2_i1:98-844(+)
MANGQRFLVLAVAASAAQAQYLRSFSSSTSWVRGEDGQMHQETHTVKTGFEQHGDMITRSRSDVVCVDGICREREVTRFGMAPQQIEQVPEWPPQHIVLMLPSERENPFLRGALFPQPKPEPEVQEIMIAAPASIVPRPGPAQVEINLPALIGSAFLAITALALGFAAVFSVMRGGSEVEARERPFADMAVPLAAAGEAADAILPAPGAVKRSTEVAEVPAVEEVPAVVAEAPFHFKPSVGTWLVARQ